MQNLEEKISRYEAFLVELKKDQEDVRLSRINLSGEDDDAISIAWVRDFGVAIALLTSMLEDWKDLNALTAAPSR